MSLNLQMDKVELRRPQECQAPTGFVAPPVMALAQTLPVSELHAPAPPEPLRGSPASIWRPPSLL